MRHANWILCLGLLLPATLPCRAAEIPADLASQTPQGAVGLLRDAGLSADEARERAAQLDAADRAELSRADGTRGGGLLPDDVDMFLGMCVIIAGLALLVLN